MKSKKMLMFFLAVNSLTATYAATTASSPKYEKMYDSVVKNLKTGKSNEKNYQLIEEVLTKRNKELKDLYEQSDYIVKPEYLEWQIFFSGQYDHIRGGDNTHANGEYHSDPSYREKGVLGKTYQGKQVSKEIDLGIRIPIKQVNREPLDLNILPPATLNIDPAGAVTISLPVIDVPAISVPSFEIVNVKVSALDMNKVTVPTFTLVGSGNDNYQAILAFGDEQGVGTSSNAHLPYQKGGDSNYYNTILAQQNLSNGEFNITLDTSNYYQASIINTAVSGITGTTPIDNGILNGDWENINRTYVMKLVGGKELDLDNMKITYTGLNDAINARFLFYTDSHNDTLNSWNLASDTSITLKGQNMIMYGAQYHGVSNPVNADSIMVNNGTIIADGDTRGNTITPGKRLIFTTVDDPYGSYNNDGRFLSFINNNIIEIDGTNDVIANFASPGNRLTPSSTAVGGTKFINNTGGIILINGVGSIGTVVAEKSATNNTITTFGESQISYNTPVELRGDQSIGAYIQNSNFDSNMALSNINVNIGTAGNKNGAYGIVGNMVGGDAALVEGAVGIYTDKAVFTVNAGNTNATAVGTHNLLFGDYASKSTLVRVDTGNVTITGTMEVNKGEFNTGLSASGLIDGTNVTSGNVTLASGANLLVSGGTNNAGAYVQDSGSFMNNGTITVSAAGTNGVIAGFNLARGTIINNGTIIKEKNGAAVVLAGGNFLSSGTVITKNGSAGIYSDRDVSSDNVSFHGVNGKVIADNGGIAFYSGTTSTTSGNIKFGGMDIAEIKNGGLMFYNNYESNGAGSATPYGKFIISSPTSINVEDGGTVFGFKASAPTSADFTNYLSNTFTGINNLTINMPTSGSGAGNLFVLNNANLNLSGIETAVNDIKNGSGLTVIGDSRFALLADSTLNIDNSSTIGGINTAYNLDDADNLINQVTAVNSLINITANTYITGTQANQVLIKQVNKVGQLPSKIAVVNNGNISMSGANAVSLYSVLGLNNTKIENTTSGIMNVGSNGIGLVGLTHNGIDSATLKYGEDKVNITNNGIIRDTTIAGLTSGLQTQPIGIYVENKSSLITRADAIAVNNGTIDFTQSLNGVGAYIKGGQFTNTGLIKVGANGVGVYASNGDIISSTGTLDLSGDKAVGYYLDSGSSFSGTGTVNVNAQNVIALNVNGGSYAVDSSLTINQAAGTNYVFANMNNGTLTTSASALTIGDNSVLLSGLNSEVRVSNGTTVTGTGDKSVVIYANGNYSNGNGAVNDGTITLANNSAALYTKSGANSINSATGIITVGETSVGQYGMGSGFITNDGIIEIGKSSQGIYGQNSGDITNNNMIKSTVENAVGIYGEGLMNIVNNGVIDLSGNNSIGIFSFTSPSSTAKITNNGAIKVGDSTNPSNPGIGIYSENPDEIVENNNGATIEVGVGSLGIYKYGYTTLPGCIEQSGKIIVGNGGTGIYSDGDIVNINSTSEIELQGSSETVGVYGVRNAKITNNSSNIAIGAGNYGFILNSGASFENNANMILANDEVLVYSDGGSTINNIGAINTTGANNIIVYSVNGEIVTNSGTINNSGGTGNIAIYNKGGSINNTGTLILGDSDIVSKNNTFLNTYAVGLYGENSTITNSGDINAGKGAVGIYSKTDLSHSSVSTNSGNIYLADGAVGLYAEGKNTQIINDTAGKITVAGDGSIGMAAVGGALITNRGTIDVTGTNAYGMYGNAGSRVENYGIINVGGTNNTAILLANSSQLINNASGTINILNGSINGLGLTQSTTAKYEVPSIINSGVINVSENFKVNGVEITIKVDPTTIKIATLSEDIGAKFVSDSVKFNAPTFEVDENNPVIVTPDFTQGTNANAYKLKDVFNPTTPAGGPNSGSVPVVSKSLTWEAIPQINSDGNVDIWMKKIPYDKFTSGLWYEDFGKNLDKKYGVDGISSEAITIFNKMDYIDNEKDFRQLTASLAGNVYANINQREEDVARVFENSLDLLQNSTNNTKENVKVNIIVGEGSRKEDTDGVVGYDYKSVGVLGLREVERTYRHAFGYSLGYLHTGFEFKDGNDSEEWVDTIQIGGHNKYQVNDWILKNDLTGRVSFHNVDRNIDWTSPNGRSEMNGTYETYSITSDNRLGKELKIGKNSSVTPYGGFRVMYVTRPTFEEDGLESVQVESNDAWSVKPRAGVEFKAEVPLGKKTAWKAKGTLDLAYEYELANLNEREKARLVAVEDGYHNLAEPEEQKGQFKTRATIGVEVEDRYGVFLTGEYVAGENSQEEYRAGVSLKAVF